MCLCFFFQCRDHITFAKSLTTAGRSRIDSPSLLTSDVMMQFNLSALKFLRGMPIQGERHQYFWRSQTKSRKKIAAMSTIASLGTPLMGAATPQGGRTPPVARGSPVEAGRAETTQLPPASELQSIERLAKTAPAPEELKTIVNDLQRTMNARASDLQFSIDEGSGKTIVRMTDRSTKDIVWQFPSEEALQISRDMENFQQGLMINKSA